MINQPETQGPNHQQGKVILPAYTDHAADNGLHNAQVRPEQLIPRAIMSSPPKNPFARLGYFWSKDPAYKVLMIAIGAVLIAGLFSVSLVSGAMLHNPNFFTLNSRFSQLPPTSVVPTGTVNLRPTFPPPAGGQGSNTSSQPPTQGTPALQPTANDTPTVQPTQGGQLTVQITGIPQHVMNNSTVDVVVNASEANVDVMLDVRYTAPPFRDFAGPSTTDANGNAIIPWSVAVSRFGGFGGVQATVVAVARDQNGQQAESQPVVVDIGGFGGN